MPAEGISRRGIFDALAAGSLVFAAAETAQAADEPPKIEPIAPFKYNIESKRGWQGEGGSAKEATVEEFPISQSIAGVSMRLKPGSVSAIVPISISLLCAEGLRRIKKPAVSSTTEPTALV